MKIIYTQNPLCSYFVMSGEDKEDFKDKLYNYWKYDLEESEENCLKWTEHQYPYFIEALTYGESHWGDCTKVATSCTKCQAEDVLGIRSADGIKNFHYISGVFGKDTTLDEAIEKLSADREYLEEWHQPHITRWEKERKDALDSLIKYKEKHFP